MLFAKVRALSTCSENKCRKFAQPPPRATGGGGVRAMVHLAREARSYGDSRGERETKILFLRTTPLGCRFEFSIPLSPSIRPYVIVARPGATFGDSAT